MRSRRRRLVALAGVAALAATGLYVWLYPYVTPTAALRMTVLRPEAERRAERFLADQTIRVPEGYRRAATFHTAGSQKAYLEQTLGLRKANRVMQSEGFVYLWHVRWFKPGQQEQYRVWVAPDGRILGYWKHLPDDAPAPESKHPEQAARAFIARAADIDVTQYRLKDSSRESLPKRREYTYTWERPAFRLGEATQRVTAMVTGDRVIYYTRYLHVPETFYHGFSREQQKGNLLARVSMGLQTIFLLAGVVAVIAGATRRDLHWRCALVPAALVAGIGLLNDINALPLMYAAFDVRQTDFSFGTGVCVSIGKALLWRFFGVVFLVAAAEWFYRRAFPGHEAIPRWFTRSGLASAPGRKRLLLGYWLVPLQLAYVAVFYMLADCYLKAWMPTQVRYDNLFSTALPWVFALSIGVQASVWEEFLFRVLAISWLKRVLKHDWLAILIPALIWGFGHCAYPNKPFYIRGVELTLWGLVFGWVFVRFGVLPSLVAHAGYNAVIAGGSFLSSVLWLPRLTFAAVLALGLVPLAAAWWWSRRGYGADEADRLSNEQLEQRLQMAAAQEPARAPSAATEPAEPARQPLPRRAWLVGGGLLALGVALLLTVEHLEKGAARYPWAEARTSRMRARCIARAAAVGAARQAVDRAGADVRGWVMSAVPREDALDGETRQYLRQFLPPADVKALGERVTGPLFLWIVRWQKPLEREYWEVRVGADGKVWDVDHGLPEAAPGPRLSPGQARVIALKGLREQGIEPRRYRLTGQRQHDYPRRTAHFFTWEPKGLRIGEAQFLTEVGIDGNRLNWIERSIKVPESYVFGRERRTPLRAIGSALIAAVSLGLVTWFMVAYVRALRRYPVDWWWGVRSTVAVAIPAVAVGVLGLPAVWAGLPDTVSPPAYLIGVMTKSAVSLLVAAMLAVAVLPLSVPLWRRGFPHVPGPRFWWRALWQPRRHRAAWREAVLAQVIVFGVVLAVAGAWEALDWALPPVRFVGAAVVAAASVPTWLVKSVAPSSPAAAFGMDGFSALGSSVCLAVAVGAGVLVLWLAMASFGKTMFRTKRRALAWYVLVAGALVLSESADWREAVTNGAGTLLGGLAVWALYRLVLRTNPLALSVSAVGAVLCGNAYDLMWFPAHRPAAIVMIAACAGLLLWALVSTLAPTGRGGLRQAPP